MVGGDIVCSTCRHMVQMKMRRRMDMVMVMKENMDMTRLQFGEGVVC